MTTMAMWTAGRASVVIRFARAVVVLEGDIEHERCNVDGDAGHTRHLRADEDRDDSNEHQERAKQLRIPSALRFVARGAHHDRSGGRGREGLLSCLARFFGLSNHLRKR